MGTPTQYYVSPASGNDTTGNGTIGTPWATVQKALNTITRDSTNGDQINVQAGGTDTLGAALTWATYGTPAVTAPCIIRGYTSAANDGGIGVVSGGGSVACINSGSLQHVKLVDMRFTNSGANTVVTLSTSNTIAVNCEVDTNTSGNALTIGRAIGCFVHNSAGIGINCLYAYGNTLRNETNDFSSAIQVAANGAAFFNIIDIDGATHGISFSGSNSLVTFNSVRSSSGTGTGIRNASSGNENAIIINNTVEGFSGVGGIGIQVVGQNADLVGYNLLYNNTTPTSFTGDINIALGNNDTAGSSPFTNAGSDDFDPITGLLASYPSYPAAWNNYASTAQNLIRMAAQYAEGAAPGGGSGRRSRIRGHGI